MEEIEEDETRVLEVVYGGRWRIEGRRVLHEVSIALNPAMVGTVQVRDARLAGCTLELSALERTRDGGTRLHRLLWTRARQRRGFARR